MPRSALLKPTDARPGRPARLPDAASAHALREQRFTPAKLAVLVDVAAQAGLDPATVLAGTGLTLADVADPFALTSPLQFLTAARNAVGRYDGTDLGVRVGRRLHASSYGMYGYAMLCSESLAHAFDSAVRYHRLANGMLPIRWVKQGDTASWLFPDRHEVALPDLDEPLYRFLIDMQFALHVTIIKDVMGGWCVPARAQFAQPRPPHGALLADALECPIAFDQPHHVLSYPAAWLARAPQLANPITAAQVSSHCAQLLDELRSQSGITRRVYEELTRTPGQFPDIDAIAEILCMTSRTLRRKLEAEGTSYSELLTSVRKALAIDYLSTTTLSTEDIALTLGFSDAVGFRHAFKRWTGTTPSDVRRKRGG
ncbi:AraC family transcriptional regulator [Burkholderia cenocepacia]|uniref:AraC family transcriptional regulator n=1 Tax=Burkholderia cenocepacia TaxID=95486 RepID=UPI0004854D22|nr:AraC family transcriptional regulator [Burkholderia cenocepacia]MBR8094324.1 AraC family transcriptional regulator [Burkholderia cenocepacia]